MDYKVLKGTKLTGKGLVFEGQTLSLSEELVQKNQAKIEMGFLMQLEKVNVPTAAPGGTQPEQPAPPDPGVPADAGAVAKPARTPRKSGGSK